MGTTESRTKIAIVAVSNGSIPIQQQARQNIHDFEVLYSEAAPVPDAALIIVPAGIVRVTPSSTATVLP